MKKSKILIILGAILLLILGIVLFISLKEDNKEPRKKTDALKFKEAYEKLNDEYAYGSIKYSSLDISENNPFVYASEEEMVDFLKNGTGIIYLGYPKCPWCRNAVNVLQHLSVDKILYLDMQDKRDTYEVVNGELKKTKDASDEYYEIMDLLKEVLLDYEIEKDGVKYNVNEKRIYVPLVVGVLNGKVVGSHTDIVDLEEGQTPFDLLNKKQQEKLMEIYDGIKAKVYGDTCSFESEHGC